MFPKIENRTGKGIISCKGLRKIAFKKLLVEVWLKPICRFGFYPLAEAKRE
jgi:hypothetical protein